MFMAPNAVISFTHGASQVRTFVSQGEALALAQMGEFSFVLLNVGREQGLVDPTEYQIAIAMAVINDTTVQSILRSQLELNSKSAKNTNINADTNGNRNSAP